MYFSTILSSRIRLDLTLRASLLFQIADNAKAIWRDLQEERQKSLRSSSIASSAPGDGIAGCLAIGFDEENDKATFEIPVSDKERSLRAMLVTARGRLRDLLFTKSAAYFFIGSCYYGCALSEFSLKLY